MTRASGEAARILAAVHAYRETHPHVDWTVHIVLVRLGEDEEWEAFGYQRGDGKQVFRRVYARE